MNAALLAALLAVPLTATSLQQESSTRPGTSLTIDGGARVTARRTVTLSIRVDGPDFKPAEMSISPDGVRWIPWRPFAPTTKFDLPEGDGEKFIYLKLSDAAGKETEPLRSSIILDTTAPRAAGSAPPAVPGDVVTLTSDVPDAVAMQFTEDPDHWAAWEPYARFKAIPLSPGEGRKVVHVRYRDEAGNVSDPLQVPVDLKPDSAPDDKPRVQNIGIAGALLVEGAYRIRIAVAASGMTEVEISVDGVVAVPRTAFSPTFGITIPSTGLPHRISAKFRDAAEVDYLAELAFVEGELPLEAPPSHDARLGIEAHFRVGPWINGFSFEAVTSLGPRKLKPGTMEMIQAGIGWSLLDPLFVELSAEFATGEDVSITSFGIDLGVRLYQGSLWVGDGELRLQAGALLSSLKPGDSEFGDFDWGTGFQGGLSARLDVTPHLALDASIQFRSVTYDWSETVLSGDTQAKAVGVAVLVGLSLKF